MVRKTSRLYQPFSENTRIRYVLGVFFLYGGMGLIILALWIFCLFDVITASELDCRNAPKGLWIILVLLLPTIGSILWLIAGRPITAPARPGGLPYKGNTGASFPEYDRPGRFVATNPDDDDEEFLKRCRERAEEQRRIARDNRTAEE